VDGSVPIIFLMVVLKIPVALLLYLVWWSIRATPEAEEAPGDGADEHEFRRWNRPKPGPRGPRRGPHAPDSQPLPACPPGGRPRVVVAPAPALAAGASARRRGSAERV
jgi:hypothetical protein